MKKMFFLISMMAILFAGCQKDEHNTAPQMPGPVPGEETTVHLMHGFKNDTKSIMEEKNVYYPGQEIYGDKKFIFKFWLNVPGSDTLPKGKWEIIRESTNETVYGEGPGESDNRNGIEHKFEQAGIYLLNVEGHFQGSTFGFEGVKIIVTEQGIVELETHPVRLYNFQVNGNNASVDVAISTEEYSNLNPEITWYHLRRINEGDFENGFPVNQETDTVRFTLSFDANHYDYVEFNAYHSGIIWLTPGAGNPPSVLYNGNIPYEHSGSYFGFRFHAVSGGAELRTYGGQLLLTTLGEVEEMLIPGENGDEQNHNYQVRWTGYTRWFKTSASNPSFRWKIGIEGDWEHISPSVWEDNPDYRKIQLPAVSGELRFQFGTGTGANFSPSSAEMQNSQYYEYGTGHLVVNI
jgi:hypothetical protein